MKYNKSPTKSITRNKENGIAFNPDEKTELFLRTASCLVGEDKFYVPGRQSDKELIELIHRVCKSDPEFVLKLAYYCRTELNLRSVPILLLGEYANSSAVGTPDSRKWVTATIQRADEITELIAYQITRNNTAPRKKTLLPMVLKEGVAAAFNKFDEYQFSKYSVSDKHIKFRNALFLTHPTSNDTYHRKLFDKIAANELIAPTDKKLISNKGINTKTEWEEAISKLGYMALLKNLSYILTSGANLDKAIERLTNKEAITKSKQFPFRFYSAYREISNQQVNDIFGQQRLLKALNTALDISIINLPKLKGNTIIIADVSGSMTSGNVSRYGSTSYKDIATLFAAMTPKICDNAIVILFADIAKAYPTNENILQFKEYLDKQNVGGSTEAWKAFRLLTETKTKTDRIIMFSDMQCYGGSVANEFQMYQRYINPDVKLYSIDLAGYGTIQFPLYAKNVVNMAGWSDKILQFIPLYEEDRKTQMEKISNLKL